MIMCIILQTHSERGHINLASVVQSSVLCVHKPWESMTCVTITKLFKGEFRECILPADSGIYICTLGVALAPDSLKELCKLGICEPVLSARLWRMQQTVTMWHVLNHGSATAFQDLQNISYS